SNIEYQYFLSVSIFSLALTPLLYRLAPRLGLHNSLASLIPQSFQNIAHNLRSHWIKPSPQGSTMNSQESAMGGHCLIIGFGVAGQEVASALRSLKLPYCILELNSSTVSKAKANGEPILFGDATKAEILHDAGIERAHLVILVVNSLDISVAILRTIHQIRPDVRVLIRLQYLRDLANLNLTANIDPIVSEFETSLEILSRTLKSYGADSKQIYEFTVAAQNRLRQTSEGLIGYQHRLIDLPSWQALASLYPIKLAAHSKALGKSLVELNLRRTTGASLVFAYREGMGVTIPGSDFILESEDTLYLLGTSESIESARMILG
ncbi:MAG: NAD-binding protein, partial [Bdellovibrionales bacterium]|nr:NAD-binding protein [Bdellovibrionales bacterium]